MGMVSAYSTKDPEEKRKECYPQYISTVMRDATLLGPRCQGDCFCRGLGLIATEHKIPYCLSQPPVVWECIATKEPVLLCSLLSDRIVI